MRFNIMGIIFMMVAIWLGTMIGSSVASMLGFAGGIIGSVVVGFMKQRKRIAKSLQNRARSSSSHSSLRLSALCTYSKGIVARCKASLSVNGSIASSS